MEKVWFAAVRDYVTEEDIIKTYGEKRFFPTEKEANSFIISHYKEYNLFPGDDVTENAYDLTCINTTLLPSYEWCYRPHGRKVICSNERKRKRESEKRVV